MYKEIIEELSNNKINNYISLKYWIYKIENIIVNNKRYIKVFLFNRVFDDEELNAITFTYSKKEYVVEKFDIVSYYGNKNIIGFIQNIDIDDNNNEIFIENEIVNGKKYTNDNRKIIYSINSTMDKNNFDFLSKKYGGIVFAPIINNDYYQCTCGRINSNDVSICKCGNSYNHVKEVFDNISTIDIERKKISYDDALKAFDEAKEINDYKKAIEILKTIEDYKDSVNIIEKCNSRIVEIETNNYYIKAKRSESIKEIKNNINLLRNYSEQIDVNSKLIELEEHLNNVKKSKGRKRVIIASIAILIVGMITFSIISINNKNKKEVMSYINNGEYLKAYNKYIEYDISDSKIAYDLSKNLLTISKYDECHNILKDVNVNSFSDAKEIREKCVGVLAFMDGDGDSYNKNKTDYIISLEKYGLYSVDDNLFHEIIYNTMSQLLETKDNAADNLFNHYIDEIRKDKTIYDKTISMVFDYIEKDKNYDHVSEGILYYMIKDDIEIDKAKQICKTRYGDEIEIDYVNLKHTPGFLYSEVKIALSYEGRINCPDAADYMVYEAYLYTSEEDSSGLKKHNIQLLVLPSNEIELNFIYFDEDNQIYRNKQCRFEIWNVLNDTLVYSNNVYIR